jgi:tyrosine-specific transport protein
MLALPVLTGLGGFFPGLVMFVICWLFMTTTGLLLLEVNVSLGHDVSIISMADKTLGSVGKAVCWVLYLFLFYCLLVAYVAGSGSLLNGVIASAVPISVPDWVGSVLFVLLFGLLVYIGTSAVDHFNRWLMAGLVISYVLLIGAGSSEVKIDLLSHQNWSYSFFMIPVLIISFGFHNIIPSLTTYLKGKTDLLKWTIYIGSALPLLIYVVWEWLVLGTVPIEGEAGLLVALEHGESASEALKKTLGHSWIGTVGQYFAFFALVTSFLAVSLSFVDFLADGLRIKKTHQGKVLLCALVFGPPLVLALSYPTIFLTALNYAGGIGAVILFGAIPAIMVWVSRYRLNISKEKLVPGGKLLLIFVLIFAIAVLGLQISQELGLVSK